MSPERVEALAEALHALGDCKRCQWAHENMWPCKSADRYRDDADQVLESPALARLLAEAWERGHFYCAAEQGDKRCVNPYTKNLP